MVTTYNQRDWDRLLAEDYTRPPEISDVKLVDDTIAYGDLIEPLGFDSIWCAEHYGSAYSQQGNPLQWLAFWAGRTERIDVGTAVIVAPWWQPVKLAHEIAMLDNLLQGRKLNLGFGRGVAPHEYEGFGIPRENSRGRFREMIEILRGLDANEFFEYHGEFFDMPLTSVRPQARHKGTLFDKIMCAANTPGSMDQAAELGLEQMFVAAETIQQMQFNVGKYNQIRLSKGFAPGQPTTMLYLHCSNDPDEIERGYRYVQAQSDAAKNHYTVWRNPGFDNVPGYEEYAERVRIVHESPELVAERVVTDGSELVGTPDQIFEKIEKLQQTCSLEYLIVHPNHGGKSPEEVQNSIKLFAKEVLPAVQAMETPLHEVSIGTPDMLEKTGFAGNATG